MSVTAPVVCQSPSSEQRSAVRRCVRRPSFTREQPLPVRRVVGPLRVDYGSRLRDAGCEDRRAGRTSVSGQEPPVEASIQFAWPRSRPPPRNGRIPASKLTVVLPQGGQQRSSDRALSWTFRRRLRPDTGPWWFGACGLFCSKWLEKRGAHCRRVTRLGRRMEKKPVHRDGPKYCLELLGESRVGESISGLSLRIHSVMTAVSSEPATRVRTHPDLTAESGCIGRARMNLRRRVLCRRALLCPHAGLDPFCVWRP